MLRETAVRVDGVEVAQDLVRAISPGPGAVEEVRPGQVQHRLVDRLAAMLEEGRSLVAEELLDGVDGLKRCGCHGVSRYEAAIQLDP